MDGRFYHFDLGDFACSCVSDGSLNYKPQGFFANAKKEEIDKALRQHDMPVDHITTPYTYLVVDAGERRVLVDMGAGDLAETTGRLTENMRAAGIEPASIDVVMITHAHPDHIGGGIDKDGKLVFTNARYFIWKREWDSGSPTSRWPNRHGLPRPSARCCNRCKTE